MSLVWLFKEHRDLYLAHEQYKKAYEVTMSDYVRKIQDLELQLSRKPALDIPQLVEELFQDIPYDDGRVPDNAWLTPGPDDRRAI